MTVRAYLAVSVLASCAPVALEEPLDVEIVERPAVPAEGRPVYRASNVASGDNFVVLHYPGGIAQALAVNDEIDVHWTYTPDGARTPACDARERFLTFCYPTAVALDERAHAICDVPLVLYVAGRTPKGETVIEQWGFLREGERQPSVLTDGTGCSWKVPTLDARRELLRVREHGRDTVRWMVPMHGKTRRLLLQFHDSRDVYELDVETQACTLVASPRAAPAGHACLHEPALALDFEYASAHADETSWSCQLYWHLPVSQSIQVLTLVDRGRDGHVDGVELMRNAALLESR
jgi:hypothetical protein